MFFSVFLTSKTAGAITSTQLNSLDLSPVFSSTDESVLQATTTVVTGFFSKKLITFLAKDVNSSLFLLPYGRLIVSAKYIKSAFGMAFFKFAKLNRPPTPESKTPIFCSFVIFFVYLC